MLSNWRILTGDVRETLRELPAGSAQTCVTSPPYFGLRDYGHAGQIGLEASPAEYVGELVAVFAEVWRVLADDGTLWLNLGDSYAGSWGAQSREHAGKHAPNVSALSANQVKAAQIRTSGTGSLSRTPGLKPKDLIGIPWEMAFALRSAGWYLRADIIWHKPNPMPESVQDRTTKSHEYVFLLSKNESYYYDADAIAEPLSEQSIHRYQRAVDNSEVFDRARHKAPPAGDTKMHRSPMEVLTQAAARVVEKGTRNKRSVWTIPTQPNPEAHFAIMPDAVAEPCILAGSKPGDVVIDPFCGLGTTGVVAIRNQRHFIGCELNPAYVQLARTRIGNVAPLLAEERTA